MDAVQQKVCMLGAPGVGKTSLVRRFVEGIFGERYHSTLGVKIDRKAVRVGDRELLLVVWDLAGSEELSALSASYIRGASGYLLVTDGTRPETFEAANALERDARETLGDVPHVLVLNKDDLRDHWQAGTEVTAVAESASARMTTSAKTGAGVDEAFTQLAYAMTRTGSSCGSTS